MKSNRKLKGFTLIELIVVMAIFSLIMFGALQLIRPVSQIFTTTYKQETVAASADNIKRFLENNLRYAQNVRIMDTAPTQDDLVQFVDRYYNGNFYMTDENGNYEYVSGDMYVMKIDNANGGKISLWQMEYKAGDYRALGSKLKENDETLYLYYNHDLDCLKADKDDIDSTVTPVDTGKSAFDADDPDVEWAVNRQMYDEYLFNISLGIFEVNDANILVRDDEYYNSFPAESGKQEFGASNFALTITAYPKEWTCVCGRENTSRDTCSNCDTIMPARACNGVDPVTNAYTYQPSYVYTASLALPNVMTRTHKIFRWKYDMTRPEDERTYRETTLGADNTSILVYDDYPAEGGAAPFANAVTNMAESNEIYIIYTYMGNDIIKDED